MTARAEVRSSRTNIRAAHLMPSCTSGEHRPQGDQPGPGCVGEFQWLYFDGFIRFMLIGCMIITISLEVTRSRWRIPGAIARQRGGYGYARTLDVDR